MTSHTSKNGVSNNNEYSGINFDVNDYRPLRDVNVRSDDSFCANLTLNKCVVPNKNRDSYFTDKCAVKFTSTTTWNDVKNNVLENSSEKETLRQFFSLRDEIRRDNKNWYNAKKKNRYRFIDIFALKLTKSESARAKLVRNAICLSMIVKLISSKDVDYRNFTIKDIRGIDSIDIIERSLVERT